MGLLSFLIEELTGIDIDDIGQSPDSDLSDTSNKHTSVDNSSKVENTSLAQTTINKVNGEEDGYARWQREYQKMAKNTPGEDEYKPETFIFPL
jgi:hypothetical protein